ncbi:MAG: cytochrome c3 family protein [Myxococcales bacterium]|nr:cytochrome c3 family protein [Myxococcales bacterium]
MKAKLFFLAALCWALVFATQALMGCGRSKPLRPAPPAEKPAADPRPPLETHPDKILEALKDSVHAKLDCSDCHAPPKGDVKPGDVGKGECSSCHEEEAASYASTIHATKFKEGKEEAATCEDCHGVHDVRAPSDEKSTVSVGNTPLTCGKCHENPELAKKLGIKQPRAVRSFVESIHGKALLAGGLVVAPSCADCHGKAHKLFAAEDPRSSVNKFNVVGTCGQCHTGPRREFEKGVHARALEEEAEKAGRKVDYEFRTKAIRAKALDRGARERKKAPIDPAAKPGADKGGAAGEPAAAKAAPSAAKPDPTQPGAAKAPVAKDALAPGASGSAASQAPPPSPAPAASAAPKATPGAPDEKKAEAPTCPTCHTAHEIIEPGARFKLAEDRICGECHKDRTARYRETYHGRAHDLGDVVVAACHDCHGSHEIWASKEPASTLSDGNRLGTCQKCHVGAPANFAGFLSHADHNDRQHYPRLYWAFIGMTALLVGTFGFFGIHSLLWLMRSLVERFRDPVAFKETKRRVREEKGARLYRRFRPIDRFVHVLVIVSFTLLVMTGMPLKFHEKAWAHAFFDQIGGASVAAAVHRFAAIVTLTYFVLHIGSLIVLVRRNRQKYLNDEGAFSLRKFLALAFGPDSPFPRWQDAKDLLGHMKWFFGRGPKPKFDRFTYWEKFDYMAVFWGVTVIGLSGLMLWYPAFFTRFLPGWSINIAHIVHSDEALLAAGFIFTFHFFNSHFRPEKFPYDAVMFSGHITEEELKHERAAQYERMTAAGELENHKQLGEWAQWKLIVNIFGAAAIVLGLALAATIFWAVLH